MSNIMSETLTSVARKVERSEAVFLADIFRFWVDNRYSHDRLCKKSSRRTKRLWVLFFAALLLD